MQSTIMAETAHAGIPQVNMPAFHTEIPLVIAHRGFSEHYPENTMPAFRAALEAGADMVEFDVQLTRDKRLAVIHDETLDRTTDGTGLVRDLSLGELYQLDAGSWFDPAFAHTRIPGIQDVLRELSGHCLINIELKTPGDAGYTERSALASSTLGTVRSRKLMDSVIFSSFDHAVLRMIRRLEPDAVLGMLADEEHGIETVLDVAAELRSASINPRAGLLDEALVDKAHALGLAVLAWPAEGEETLMEKTLSLGVDGFFANDIEAMRRAALRFRNAD